MEPLEDRRLLAVVTVGNALDSVNGDVSSIKSLFANDGGDGISFREAIAAANNTVGPNEIQFDEAHFTSTEGVADAPILLDGESLIVTDVLTITGLGVDRTVIDGQELSRLLEVGQRGEDPALVIRDLHLTRGKTEDRGGAISKPSTGVFSLERVLIDHNMSGSSGGGIWTDGEIDVIASEIADNSSGLNGGGILAFSANIVGSVLRDNSATESGGAVAVVAIANVSGGSIISGNSAFDVGGGISADGAVITDSTLIGNVVGDLGGGVWAMDVQMLASTVADNRTLNDGGQGGGVFSIGNASIVQSTVSGNAVDGTNSRGGGIVGGRVTIRQTTVVDNSANALGSSGGGVYARDHINSVNSILDGNSADDVAARNLLTEGTEEFSSSVFDVHDSIEELRLAPLADNGGFSPTHVALPGSASIDAGINREARADALLLFDQRGLAD